MTQKGEYTIEKSQTCLPPYTLSPETPEDGRHEESDGGPARSILRRPQAVPVATKEATGIDSRDEGLPFPLNPIPQPKTHKQKSPSRLEQRGAFEQSLAAAYFPT